MDNKKRVIVTIVLSLIEFAAYFVVSKCGLLNIFSGMEMGWISSFLQYVTPAGILYLINYYVVAPLVYRLMCVCWHLTGHYARISKYFDGQAQRCFNWLIQARKHWGPLSTSEECQNANTCEALISLKKSNYDAKYKEIYKRARQDILKNVTEKGLASKSLNYETVVCTSMILHLVALEKKSAYIIPQDLDEKFEKIATNLWSIRSERGWGVYVEKTDTDYCCVANTLWALIALNDYSVSQTEEYKFFLKSIYEYSSDSLFGFVTSDRPRLCTTAMAVILYFSLEEELKKDIDRFFDVKKAIDYIFKNFCIRNIQCETETLRGIDLRCPGAKKVPWTHMTMGFAMEALNLAFDNKKLSLIKMDVYVHKVKMLCKTKLVNLSEQNQCYFIPSGMQIREDGVYTFPTAYFVMGLSYFLKKYKND